MESIAEVSLAAIAAIAATIAGYFKFRTHKDEVEAALAHDQLNLTMAEREKKYHASGKDLIAYISFWNDLEREVGALLDSSPLDRFVILRGWNGIRAPTFTTAIYQYKSNSADYLKFDHVELDKDYTDRLRDTYQGPQAFSVKDLGDDILIKRIYNAEGILSSVWFYIISQEVEGVPERATVYCSFGSTSVEHLDATTLMRAELVVSKIRAIMYKFRDS